MERQLSDSSFSSQVAPTIDEFSWDDCGESHQDESTKTRSITAVKVAPSKSSLQGILRYPSIATKCPLPTSSTTADIWRQALWKCVLLVLVPMIGYSLSQLYPSSVLFHFTFLCFVYGLVDLMEHDPALSISSHALLEVVRSSPKASRSSYVLAGAGTTTTPSTIQQNFSKTYSLLNHERRRRVQFAKGTKFYRLPKPKTRKQRQAHLREQRLQEYTLRTSASTPTPISCSAIEASSINSTMTCATFPIRTIEPESEPAPPTAITDWEATNRLLKAIIEHDRPPEPQPMRRDDDVKFSWQKSLEELMEENKSTTPDCIHDSVDSGNRENIKPITDQIPNFSSVSLCSGSSISSPSSSCNALMRIGDLAPANMGDRHGLDTNSKVLLQDHSR